MGKKLEELERIRADLEKAGWLSGSDAISTADLDRDALDHFMAALLQADNVLGWALSSEDAYGASPQRGHVLSATIQRLIVELGRIKAGADSRLFSREGKRYNSRQTDPGFVNLKLLVGLFDRHFADLYRSSNKKHEAVVAAVHAAQKSANVRSVGEWIQWFSDAQTQHRTIRLARSEQSPASSDWSERETAMCWLYERQLAQQVVINRSRRHDPDLPRREDVDLSRWLLEQITDAAARVPTLARAPS